MAKICCHGKQHSYSFKMNWRCWGDAHCRIILLTGVWTQNEWGWDIRQTCVIEVGQQLFFLHKPLIQPVTQGLGLHWNLLYWVHPDKKGEMKQNSDHSNIPLTCNDCFTISDRSNPKEIPDHIGLTFYNAAATVPPLPSLQPPVWRAIGCPPLLLKLISSRLTQWDKIRMNKDFTGLYHQSALGNLEDAYM